jgi:hypothetical protein
MNISCTFVATRLLKGASKKGGYLKAGISPRPYGLPASIKNSKGAALRFATPLESTTITPLQLLKYHPWFYCKCNRLSKTVTASSIPQPSPPLPGAGKPW